MSLKKIIIFSIVAFISFSSSLVACSISEYKSMYYVNKKDESGKNDIQKNQTCRTLRAVDKMSYILGGSLDIIDGYRVKATASSHSAKNSQHFYGRAFDIRFPNRDWKTYGKSYLEAAKLAGFDAYGFGRNSIHVDTRGSYAWWCYDGNGNFVTSKTSPNKSSYCPKHGLKDYSGGSGGLTKVQIGKAKVFEKIAGKSDFSGDEYNGAGQGEFDNTSNNSGGTNSNNGTREPTIPISQFESKIKGNIKVNSEGDLEAICNDPKRKEAIEKGLIKYDGGICENSKSGFQGLFDTISAVLSWVMKLIMIISVFALFFIGFKFIAARGNPTAMNEAKGLLTNIVIGLFLIFSAFFIVNFLFEIFLIEDSYNFLEKVG